MVDTRVSPAVHPERTNRERLEGGTGWVGLGALGGLALVAIAVLRGLHLEVRPAEDAAMLLHYARHLAEGHGIVFNVGEAPVDGATDFGFMVLVAGLARAGMAVETAARALNIAAFAGILGLVVWSAVRLHRQPVLAGALVAAYVAVGPVGHYIEWSFGTMVFGLAVACTWVCAEVCLQRPSRRTAVTLGVVGLVTALIRPEGVIVVALALGVLLLRGGRAVGRSVLGAGAVFAAGGAVYLAWRWSYFGYPLPNPYYKKGGGTLHPDGLRESAGNVARMLWPGIPFFVLATWDREGRRRALAGALAIAAFTGSWVLLSPEMNFGGRFQFPAVMMAAVSLPGLLGPIRSRFRLEIPWRRLVAAGALAVLVVAGFASHQRFGRSFDSDHGRQQLRVAEALAPYAGRNLTLATTEAGRIPFYSRWRTIDAWGLNDQWVAHHAGITEERLAALDPDLIFVHAFFSPLGPKPPPDAGGWAGTTGTLARYAEGRGMQLVFGWGPSPQDTWILYAGPRVPPELVRSLRALRLDGQDYARAG